MHNFWGITWRYPYCFSKSPNQISMSIFCLKVINPDHFESFPVSCNRFQLFSTNSDLFHGNFCLRATFLTWSHFWTSSPSKHGQTLKRGFRDFSGPSMSSLDPFGPIGGPKRHSLTFWSIVLTFCLMWFTKQGQILLYTDKWLNYTRTINIAQKLQKIKIDLLWIISYYV